MSRHGAAAACVFITATLLTLCAAVSASSAYTRYHASESTLAKIRESYALDDKAEQFMAETLWRLAQATEEAEKPDDETAAVLAALYTLADEFPALTVTETPEDTETLAILNIVFKSGSKKSQLHVTFEIDSDLSECRILEKRLS